MAYLLANKIWPVPHPDLEDSEDYFGCEGEGPVETMTASPSDEGLNEEKTEKNVYNP